MIEWIISLIILDIDHLCLFIVITCFSLKNKPICPCVVSPSAQRCCLKCTSSLVKTCVCRETRRLFLLCLMAEEEILFCSEKSRL